MKKLKIKLFQKSMNLKTMNNAYYEFLDFFKGGVNKMFLCRTCLLLIVRDIIIAITLAIVTIC